MHTQTITAMSPSDLQEQIQASKTTDFKPTLGYLFGSIEHDLNQISQIFDTEDIDLFGCSSAGEILNEEVYEKSIVCVLSDLNRDFYKIVTKASKGKVYQASFDIGLEATEAFANPAVLIASGGVSIDAEQIIFGLRDSIKRNIPVFGGLAADDLKWTSTYALSRHGITEQGITALILDNDKIEVTGLATSGWEPIGAEHTITKAEGNIVYTINDEPALDVFLKYFGYFDNGELDGVPINTMSAQYPLQIIREDGDYTVLRSPLFDAEDKSLILAGGVRQGDKFKFSISPGFEVIDKTIEEFGGLEDSIKDIDMSILFSCKGRHAALGPMIEDEIAGIYNYWKKPLIGLFSYGEIGNVKGGQFDFHNETCSLVVLKER